MANIKYGPLADEVAGTVGGVTFARSAYSKTCRAWRAKINKRRPGQLTVRTHNAQASQLWYSALTQDQRDDWELYAGTCAFTNSLGEVYYLNGFNMFVRNTSIALNGGGPYSYDPPSQSGFPGDHTLTLSLEAATGHLHLTDVAPDALDTELLLFQVHALHKSSRQFPVRRAIATSILCPLPGGLPYLLHDWATDLGVAGALKTWLSWYWLDEYYRTSTQKIQEAISS